VWLPRECGCQGRGAAKGEWLPRESGCQGSVFEGSTAEGSLGASAVFAVAVFQWQSRWLALGFLLTFQGLPRCVVAQPSCCVSLAEFLYQPRCASLSQAQCPLPTARNLAAGLASGPGFPWGVSVCSSLALGCVSGREGVGEARETWGGGQSKSGAGGVGMKGKGKREGTWEMESDCS